MTMTSPKTGQAHSIAESQSSGTTSTAQQNYQCQDTSRQHYTNINTPSPCNPNIHHTHIIQLPMEPNNNYQHQKTLFYARAVDPTMIMPLSTIATAQSIATQYTIHTTNQILDYCATHPDATIPYQASGMILKIHSDASYLAEPKARSRGGGHYYVGNKPSSTPEPAQGPLLNRSNVIRSVMGSAAEAEVGGLYDNIREGVPLRNTTRNGIPTTTNSSPG
jgi:hypothetical protein